MLDFIVFLEWNLILLCWIIFEGVFYLSVVTRSIWQSDKNSRLLSVLGGSKNDAVRRRLLVSASLLGSGLLGHLGRRLFVSFGFPIGWLEEVWGGKRNLTCSAVTIDYACVQFVRTASRDQFQELLKRTSEHKELKNVIGQNTVEQINLPSYLMYHHQSEATRLGKCY